MYSLRTRAAPASFGLRRSEFCDGRTSAADEGDSVETAASQDCHGAAQAAVQ